MSTAEKWLQVHIVVLVILSTLLLGNGLNSWTVPLVAGTSAVIAFIFTERLRWFYLNRSVANMLAIAVAGLAIYRFFQEQSTGDIKLAAIANLLTYVQVILLFQQKSPRLYWNIWVLSLLQVVVAGALSLHFQVGVLFFVFFLVSLSAMTVMSVYVDAGMPPRQDGKSKSAPDIWAGGKMRKRTLRGVFESLAEQEAIGVEVNTSQPGPLGKLMRMSWVAGMITIIFAALLFYSIPRHDDAWYGPSYSNRAKVGFSSKVSFDYVEVISPSNRAVMRVQFWDEEGKAKKLATEPYFRGATVPVFQSGSNGTSWLPSHTTTSRSLSNPPDIQPRDPSTLPKVETDLVEDDIEGDLTDGYSLVRQETDLQPVEHFILFSQMPAFKNAGTSQQVRFDHGRESLVRNVRADEYSDGPFHFEVAVPLEFDRPFSKIPARQKVWEGMYETRRPDPRDFPALYEEAATVVKKVEGTENRELLAFRMSEHLGNNEEFTYTLNYRNVKFDRTLNPIEDFIRNHKMGHCEYYAAALALMLRTVDIPSRLVIGYKGGEFNKMGKFYEVKEKHAHVWVEAYLPVEDCSPRMLATGQASPKYGAWFRLDPTPQSNDEVEAANRKGLVDQAGDAISYAQYVWDDYVVGLNSERQQRNLFNPNKGGLLGTVFGEEGWQGRLAEVPSEIRRDFWKYFVGFLLIAACVLGVSKIHRAGVARFSKKTPRRNPLRGHRVVKVVDAISPWLANLIFGESPSDVRVDFYQRFLKVLRKRGVTPAGYQTAWEFAATVEHRLGMATNGDTEQTDEECLGEDLSKGSRDFSRYESLDSNCSADTSQLEKSVHPRLRAILGVITNEFYRVRFGQDSLDNSRAEKVENALRELESMLASQPARSPNVNASAPQIDKL